MWGLLQLDGDAAAADGTGPVLGICDGIPRLRRNTRGSKIQAIRTPTQTFDLVEIPVHEQSARIFWPERTPVSSATWATYLLDE